MTERKWEKWNKTPTLLWNETHVLFTTVYTTYVGSWFGTHSIKWYREIERESVGVSRCVCLCLCVRDMNANNVCEICGIQFDSSPIRQCEIHLFTYRQCVIKVKCCFCATALSMPIMQSGVLKILRFFFFRSVIGHSIYAYSVKDNCIWILNSPYPRNNRKSWRIKKKRHAKCSCMVFFCIFKSTSVFVI